MRFSGDFLSPAESTNDFVFFHATPLSLMKIGYSENLSKIQHTFREARALRPFFL